MKEKPEESHVGQPTGPFQDEELKSLKEKEIGAKKRIIEQLNEIKVPLSVTVFSHGAPWTIRNISFWEVFKKNDEDILEFMEKFLTEGK